MRRPNAIRRGLALGPGLVATALLVLGADEPRQTIDARGLTFQAPKSWKSSPPTSSFRVAQLKVEPIGGEDYPAEMVVTAFAGGAGPNDAAIERWRLMFKKDDGTSPPIETKKVPG